MNTENKSTTFEPMDESRSVERTNERMTIRLNDWVHERVNTWVLEGRNEWMHEWMDEWMDRRMMLGELSIYRSKQLFSRIERQTLLAINLPWYEHLSFKLCRHNCYLSYFSESLWANDFQQFSRILPIDWVHERVNTWVLEGMNERMHEWMDKWMDEWMDGSANDVGWTEHI